MSATDLGGYTVFDQLRREGVPLRVSARLGDGVGAALWDRNEIAWTKYENPGHHTLSLYVEGGSGISRRGGRAALESAGAGSLCLMPSDLTTDWDVSGEVRLFHLYIPRAAFDRVVVEALDADPARVSLRDATYFHDAYLEAAIRGAVLPLSWDEPADRLAVSHASQMMLAYLASRFTDRGSFPLAARGGLSPGVLRRVTEFMDAHVDRPLCLGDLAGVAGLSAFHFARAFKRSTGQSPHDYLLRQRIERAKRLIETGQGSLAEIALSCGFSGQSHFTARFRQVTSLTPGQFQRATGASRRAKAH
ncbi:AraC family transcriptional regulator [Inquilinus sp. CAU 1745]|uniref:AraC family transcriptional regulator n=1 Tax=Inquilinus sp. CAU 1745 TaxID=3140369 RepID=UPI00325B596B